MFIYELEDLEDIIDTLVFEDEPSIFTEEYANDLIETALQLMDEYISCNPHSICEPNFNEILLEEIKDIFYIQMEHHIEDLYNGEDIEEDMNELLEDAFNIFISTFYPDKLQDKDNNFQLHANHNDNTKNNEYNNEDNNLIEQKIQQLREIPQPVQRTPEWYQFRWNLITASNAWKAFESQSSINQLIYEKCQPLKSNDEENACEDEPVKMVNVNTPMHWGQKYEPLSVLIYEHMYNTKVEDFGCIQHPNYKFLGASPDGIVVNNDSQRFGRMLEIKNPTTREITGIPKKEYWVQMQLQMEVCDLDECDFLETKFSEYSSYEKYKDDSSIAHDTSGNEFNSYVTTKDSMYKGIIIHFYTKEGTPFYIYQPLNLYLPKDIEEWEETNVEKYQCEPYNYIFLKFIYWRLDKLSCVLVLRNKEWFKNSIGQLEKVWKTIEEERVTGYEHRAPNKKQKKDSLKPFISNNESKGCLLTFNKIIKVDHINHL
jgi:putative phage-type endonuclease